MKVFLYITLIVIAVGIAAGSPTGQSSSNVNVQIKQEPANEQKSYQNLQLDRDLNRYRKSPGYSAPASPASSIPVPPCPRNYLFSCSPNLAPVPCAASSVSAALSGSSAHSHGHAGAYTAPVPAYIAPADNTYAASQNLNKFLPQALGQFYQY